MEKRDLAAVCGGVSNNLVVVDFDDPELYHEVFGKGTEQITLVVKTSKVKKDWKRHVYFIASHPAETQHLEGVDIQGEGAYVKIPPSKGYNPERWPVEQIEKWEGDFNEEIKELLKRKAGLKFESKLVHVGDLFKPAPIGKRHAKMIRLITWMRLCGVTKEDALQKIIRWNDACEEPKDRDYLEYQLDYLYEREEPYHFRFDEEPHEMLSEEVLRKGREILRNGDPLQFFVDTLHLLHTGDDKLAQLEWVSLIGSWVEKIKINTWAIGESGTGKSHLKQSVMLLVPSNLYECFTSSSPMALFYYIKKYGEWSLDKKLIYIDEVEASRDTLPVLRNLTGQTEITPRHLSVYDAELLDLKVKGKRTVWFTSVRVIGSDQIQKRFLNTSPDDSIEQDVDVWELQELQEQGLIQIDKERIDICKAMTQIIVDETADLKVTRDFIPFFPLLGERRLYPIFLATIKVLTKICFLQRKRENENEIKATVEDFERARKLWAATEKTITHRVAGKPLQILERLSDDPEKALTYAELASLTGFSTSSVRNYTKELAERDLINSRKRSREGRGRNAWEFWLAEQPSAIEIELVSSVEEARRLYMEYIANRKERRARALNQEEEEAKEEEEEKELEEWFNVT